MAFTDKLNQFISQSIEVSGDFLKKAGEKAKELGEKGVLQFEIIQYKGRAEKQLAQLGTEIYARLREKGEVAINRDDEKVKVLLDKVAALESEIDEREAKFKKLGGKDEELKPEA